MLSGFLISVGTAFPIVVSVVVAAVRIEHRMTEIETNIKWLVKTANNKGCCENVNKESEE